MGESVVATADSVGDALPQTDAFSAGGALGPNASDVAVETSVEDAAPSTEVGDSGLDPHATKQNGGDWTGLWGNVDRAYPSVVEGWVWDPAAPDKPVVLELVEGDIRLATVVADELRPDLVQSNIGDGRHAFSLALEPGLLSEGRHVLQLRCADTREPLQGSPFVLEVAPVVRTPALRWHMDEITDSEVAGWIYAPDEPMRHCVVALKEGGETLARGVASSFRGDLLAAGVGDGCHAFKFETPRSLLDGRLHVLEVIEEKTGVSLTDEPIQWRSGAGTADPAVTGPRMEATGEAAFRPIEAERAPMPRLKDDGMLGSARGAKRGAVAGSSRRGASAAGTRLLFDISDLVYYIGHHANLTGIQRVQSSIVLAMMDGGLVPPSSVTFLSFNARTRNWVALPTGFLVSVLRDLFLPEPQRMISFPAEEARYGLLPGARPFDGEGVLDDSNPSVVCLLGAAWVQQDYIHRVLSLKRRFGTRFVMTVHDLIPIYARETCDQDTARVFDEFMRRALRHVDHILAVSENTAKDARRYLASLRIPEPAMTVTKNGSSFAEFLPDEPVAAAATRLEIPERFVLFVATIEGRKNHQLIFDLWKQMVEDGDDPPDLICVGRLGWKATAFVSALVETDYLDGRVHLLREISDTDLQTLYQKCMFTVCPTFYEGWGLPVGESLALGKICVCSDRSSIPEVAGDCGVYIDIDRKDQALAVIRDLIGDEAAREELEAKIRREYQPITWRSVAERVVAACNASVAVAWREPYPYCSLPYSTEISFGRLDPDTDGVGESVMARIVDSRLGHFRHDLLDQDSFLLGEEIRSGGSWAQPERWGTWLCHTGGDVVFSLAANASQWYYVFVRVRVTGPLNEHAIAFLANTELLWKGRIGPISKDLTFRIRKRGGPASAWKLRLKAEVDLAPDVRNHIAGLDSRVPTIGFERLIVIPESDVTARLDVVSSLMVSRN